MREIVFYRSLSGNCPVEDFLDSLTGKQAQKVLWVLRLVEELETIPRQYFKKLIGSDDLWEIRAQVGGNTYRILAFLEGSKVVVLAHGFAKKTQKIPRRELDVAEKRRQDSCKGAGTMTDLMEYTRRRAQRDLEFAEGLETGYEDFKIGVLLRRAREEAGLTQQEIAERLETQKSAISRIENRAGDIRLSTLERYAEALGWSLSVKLQPPQRAT